MGGDKLLQRWCEEKEIIAKITILVLILGLALAGKGVCQTSTPVADEEKRQRYLNTLRKEAERLGHLVENVLSYAPLYLLIPAKLLRDLNIYLPSCL